MELYYNKVILPIAFEEFTSFLNISSPLYIYLSIYLSIYLYIFLKVYMSYLNSSRGSSFKCLPLLYETAFVFFFVSSTQNASFGCLQYPLLAHRVEKLTKGCMHLTYWKLFVMRQLLRPKSSLTAKKIWNVYFKVFFLWTQLTACVQCIVRPSDFMKLFADPR